MFDGTSLTVISDVDQDTLMFGSHEIPSLIDVSSPSTNKSRMKMKNKHRKGLNSTIKSNSGE